MSGFYCHGCAGSFRRPETEHGLSCPNCGSEFVEEVEAANDPRIAAHTHADDVMQGLWPSMAVPGRPAMHAHHQPGMTAQDFLQSSLMQLLGMPPGLAMASRPVAPAEGHRRTSPRQADSERPDLDGEPEEDDDEDHNEHHQHGDEQEGRPRVSSVTRTIHYGPGGQSVVTVSVGGHGARDAHPPTTGMPPMMDFNLCDRNHYYLTV
jgi:hypothetical protein